MSRLLRTAASAALTVAAFGALATAASAQSYDRLVVFGDSLSDNGNLYARTGNYPPSPPYYQGRFSNGPVFTELLGFDAGRFAAGASLSGDVNLAFGGAVTGRETRPGQPPGLTDQLDAYLGLGGTFDSGDLVSVLGGANNIFQRIETFAALPPGHPALASPTGFVQPTAVAAAADMTALVDRIAGAGAGTILVSNLPRLGITPQFNQGDAAAAAPLADFAGSTFNSALLAGVTATAAARPDSNIIMMDLYKASEALAASPTRFGLTNATDRCFNDDTLTVCGDPDGYLYWDTVHPTAAGHRLLAALSADYLYYGDLGAQSTVQGETAFRQREDLLDLSSQQLSGRAAWETGTRLTFGVLGDSVETDARGVVAESEATGYGVRAGIDHAGSDRWRFGVAATFRNTEVEAGPMDFDLESYAFDAYAGWRSGAIFLNAAVGGSVDQFDDITRLTSLAPIVHTGKTDGGGVGARLQGGMWFDMGGIAISPRAALAIVSTDVNGYIEDGAAAQYAYQDRTLQATTGEVALRAEGGGDSLNFWVEGGYRDSLTDDSDAVGTGIAANPAQVLYREFDNPFGGSLLASAGLEAGVMGGTVSVGYRGRFGDAADSHMGQISFTLPLH